MGYSSLRACIDDLEENKLLIRIKEEMDPNLEMASRHLQEFKNSGKALLFENIKGSKYSASQCHSDPTNDPPGDF